ncbi:MAG: copper homeostasis protein CutC [Turicibacter sp.]|nr:copper homeostasis protein CutC [Turicibacter sp.]
MLEIIAMTVEDAKRIEAGGGQRIELVSALSEGGLTPSYGLIKKVCESVTIPVNVIIRPHSKGFVYPPEEIEVIAQDILMAKKLGANGVVIGVLNPDNTIDFKALEQLLELCGGLDVTFHRAIDELADIPTATAQLAAYPQITNILTSGGLAQPIEKNTAVLRAAHRQKGDINILLGGGLNLENVAKIKEESGATDFHFGSAVRTDGEIDVEKIKKIRGIIG